MSAFLSDFVGTYLPASFEMGKRHPEGCNCLKTTLAYLSLHRHKRIDALFKITRELKGVEDVVGTSNMRIATALTGSGLWHVLQEGLTVAYEYVTDYPYSNGDKIQSFLNGNFYDSGIAVVHTPCQHTQLSFQHSAILLVCEDDVFLLDKSVEPDTGHVIISCKHSSRNTLNELIGKSKMSGEGWTIECGTLVLLQSENPLTIEHLVHLFHFDPRALQLTEYYHLLYNNCHIFTNSIYSLLTGYVV